MPRGYLMAFANVLEITDQWEPNKQGAPVEHTLQGNIVTQMLPMSWLA